MVSDRENGDERKNPTGAPGVVAFHRPARIFPAPPSTDAVRLAAPPLVPQRTHGSMIQVLLPVIGSLGMVGFALIYRNVLFLIIAGAMAGLMLLASIGMRMHQKRQVKKTRARNTERYLAYLAQKRDELERVAEQQMQVLQYVHPTKDGLWSVVNTQTQLWERRRGDPDFLSLRIGRGPVDLSAPIDWDLGDDPLAEHEPELLKEAEELVDRFRCLEMAPIAVPLQDAGVLAIVGPPTETRDLARALIAEATVMHAPDDVRVIASFRREDLNEWGWLKWLPHARGSSEVTTDDQVPVSLAVDVDDLEVLLSQIVKPRLDHLERVRDQPGEGSVSFQQVVVLLDELEPSRVTQLEIYEQMLRRATDIGILVITLVPDARAVPSTVGARIDVEEGGWVSFMEAGPGGTRMSSLRLDGAGTPICESIARAMAPLRLRIRNDQVRRVDSESLNDLLHSAGAKDFDAATGWRAKPTRDLLVTPIGVAEDGSHVVLDLKESAEEGMGPHGLIVGATGSGKSELLRTLVTGLALTHQPDELSFVLVDYKGGATFAELSQLPHCAGMITNIESDLSLVDRMHEALFGELERRQRLLQSVGHFDRALDYQEHRKSHPDEGLPPLPSLVVIVDEFGELLTRRPDFLDLFVSIGRTGRSLGVHLLLSTQRLDEGRIRGLEGHLRYRICLRTFSAEESMLALGSRDAFEMPPLPGLGYMRVDGSLQHFKAALCTRPYRERRAFDQPDPRVVRGFGVKGSASIEVALDDARPVAEETTRVRSSFRTEMQVAVERLSSAANGQRVRQVWLPPLPPAVTLDAVSDVWDKTTSPGESSWLFAPVGVLDRPREQDQLPFSLAFTGRGGHLAVVGAPRTGKSVLLQTMVSSLALLHDPRDVQIYAIDLGGGGLHALAGLPHVGGVYGRGDRNGINRLVRELRSLVAERSALFREHGLGGIDAYHAARREGSIKDDGYGEVFLVIDNWALLAQEFEDLQYEISDFAAGALHYGVHLVITSNRWHDIRLSLRDNIGGRIELRLNDPIESEIDRHAAKALPDDVPGRAIQSAGQQVQIALPRMDGHADITGLSTGVEQIVERASVRWQGSTPAPTIKMLPDKIRLADARYEGDGVLIGLEEFGLEPVTISKDDDQPHLLVFGDDGAGKTNLLRTALAGIVDRYSPDDARVAIVDYRRQLLDAGTTLPHSIGFAANHQTATDLAMKLSTELTARLPAEGLAPVTSEAQGPHIFLLIDDYDLVASSTGNPLTSLVDLLAQGRDVGFHVIATRRVGGTTRSSFEPFFQRLVELGASAIILSGDPQEGPLVGGVKAQPLPPGRGILVTRQTNSLVQTIEADEPPLVRPEGQRKEPE